jgi:hypothetical protein
VYCGKNGNGYNRCLETWFREHDPDKGTTVKIIAIEREREGTSAADFQTFLQDEAKAVWQLQQENIIREIYFREDLNTAVLVLECASLSEAQRTLARLPLVQKNLIEFELIPLRPYPGFSRLFKDMG